MARMSDPSGPASPPPGPILIVGNSYPPHTLGGYELLCRDHVAWLRARGHPVTVLTSTYGVQPKRTHIETGAHGEHVVRALDFHWRDFKIERPTGFELIAGERRQRLALEHVVTQDRPRAVELWHMAALSKSLIAVLARYRLPTIAVVGENWPTWDVQTDNWLRLMRHGPRRDQLLRPGVRSFVAHTIAPAEMNGAFERVRPAYCSEFLKKDVESRFAPWRGRGVTVHNGIDLATMSRERDPSEPLGRPLRLLYCGRVERRKGVATAVEAMSLLKEKGIDATLDIVGWRDEAFAAELRALAASTGVAGAVQWLEPRARESLPDLYRAHDVLVFPAIWEEPFGLVPLEAMATGCIVVGTGTGGSAEVMIDGKTALLHERENAGSLADRIAELTRDPGLVATLRTGARAMADEHDIETYHRALASLLEEAARA